MRFWVLGPLRVGHPGALTGLTARKSRTLLAALLLDANAAVSTDRLVEALWGSRPPASAVSSLHNHLLRLRRTLEDGPGTRIVTAPPGYLIRVEPGELDSDLFAGHAALGRSAELAGRWDEAFEQFSAALALWRGDPLADAEGLDGWRTQLQRLHEDRLQALEGRIGAELQLGRHYDVIGELRSLTAEHLLRESLHGKLMTALYRADRQAEALDVFRRLRHTLIEELGVEPSPSLQDLQRRILRADPALGTPGGLPDRPDRTAAPTPASASAPAYASAPAADRAAPAPATDAEADADRPAQRAGARPTRCQLPADTPAFTGRSRELDQLVELAREASGGSRAGTVVISAINGMAGIGKSALAVRTSHLIAGDYPDGQLFVDLHGHTPGVRPLTPAEALDRLLRSLDVPPQTIPADLDERAVQFRARLAGTRTLLLLDNAADTAQVRPLLPADPGCLVLVTSRRQLTGLYDAHPLPLDLLSEAEAVALLHKAAGPGRIPADHPAIGEVVALCGRVPLAVRIVAARLRNRPALQLDALVEQLRDERRRLSFLRDEDRELTAVFASSYLNLPAAEQRLFRRLGQVPGPDFDAYAAANLIGADHGTAEQLLETLLDHSLLAQHVAGRYRFHDLVRLYSRSLEPDGPAEAQECEAGLRRLLDYYEHTAHAADALLRRHHPPVPWTPGASPLVAPDLADWNRALLWMRAERDNLLAVARSADHPQRLLSLTGAVAAFIFKEGPLAEGVALHRAAAEAALDRGDRAGAAAALWQLGRAQLLSWERAAAGDSLRQALAMFQELGNPLGEAHALHECGRERAWAAEFPAAIEFQERALAIYRDQADGLGEGTALCELGRLRHTANEHAAASELLAQSLTVHQKAGHRQGEADALSQLGRVRYSEGEFTAAADLYERALVIYQELGGRQGEANTLGDLGRLRHSTGDLASAAQLLERALEISQDLGHHNNGAFALWDLGRLRHDTGALTEAADLLGRALRMFQGLGNRNGEANALHELGRVRHSSGEWPAAAELLGQAAAIFHDLDDTQGEAEVLNSTGALLTASHGPEQAEDLYRRALSLARAGQSPLDEARALEGLARCAAHRQDRAAALSDLGRAVALYRRIGAREAAEAAAYLAYLEES